MDSDAVALKKINKIWPIQKKALILHRQRDDNLNATLQ